MPTPEALTKGTAQQPTWRREQPGLVIDPAERLVSIDSKGELVIDLRDVGTEGLVVPRQLEVPADELDAITEAIIFASHPVDHDLKERMADLLCCSAENWQVRECMALLHGVDKQARQYTNRISPLLRHTIGVGLLAGQLARNAGEEPEFIDMVMKFGVAHDVGKWLVGIKLVHPPSFEESQLSAEEWAEMKTHVLLGHVVVRSIYREDNTGLLDLAIGRNLPLMHHCNADSDRSYPTLEQFAMLVDQGLLTWEELEDPMLESACRYVRMADKYDAVSSGRIYASKRGHEDPAEIWKVLTEDEPESGREADALMQVHLLRFPPDGWMPKITR